VKKLRDLLIARGEELLAQPRRPVSYAKHPEADALINNLKRHPHAFVLGCLMDRKVKSEKAWRIPYLIHHRTGTASFGELAALTEESIRKAMAGPPALHVYVRDMADIFYAAVQRIATEYGGDASRIWRGRPSSAAIVRRFLEFHGVGPKIATMAANSLVRDFKIPVRDKNSIDISVDVHVRRVFGRLGLIRPDASVDEIIYRARELSPDYPGIFDLAVWEIGREWCRPKQPVCEGCIMKKYCPTAAGKRPLPVADLHPTRGKEGTR